MALYLIKKLLYHKKDIKLWVWSVTEGTILTSSSNNEWVNDLLKMWQWKKIEKWARIEKDKSIKIEQIHLENGKIWTIKEEILRQQTHAPLISLQHSSFQFTLMSYWEGLRLSLASRALFPRPQDRLEVPWMNVTGRAPQSIMDRIWYISIPDSSSPDGTI